LTPIVIDLAIIGIIVYSTWRGYRNGLIRGAFGIVALVVALIIANIAATTYADEFEGMLLPFVGGVVDTTLNEMTDPGIDYDDAGYEDPSEAFNSAYTALRQMGLPRPAAVRIAELASGDNVPEGFSFSDVIADKLSSALSYIAVFAVAFTLVAIVFAVIGNLIGFVFALPGLRLLDVIAGTVFGLVKGLIIVMAIATVVRYFGLLALDLIEDTTVLNYFINQNIVADILGI